MSFVQNEGEVNTFEVHVLNNNNNKATNIWALPNPKTTDWHEGRVEVLSEEGEKEYQVNALFLF